MPVNVVSKKEGNSMELDKVTQDVLDVIDSYGFKQKGAYNLRLNGMAVCHGDSRHIHIVKKEDRPGIDIHISGEAKNEQVHIPVVMSKEGVDVVYNDFYIEDGADVTIIAGCGIHGEGCSETRHDGIHTFHVGENANVKYIENHYAQGDGTGKKVLNPVTKIYVGENSVFTLETSQIKGVDSTERENYIELAENAKLFVTEKLMTHEEQTAISNMDVQLMGENSSARIVSRSVAKGKSRQVFHPKAIGNNLCHAHVQCDSIIMDEAEISSIPEINARHVDAQIVHEAAIGRINDEQLIKLRTFGLSEEEAEAVIIENFLK
jgi:Fe-S cluster assembly scaffold protein SufB